METYSDSYIFTNVSPAGKTLHSDLGSENDRGVPIIAFFLSFLRLLRWPTVAFGISFLFICMYRSHCSILAAKLTIYHTRRPSSSGRISGEVNAFAAVVFSLDDLASLFYFVQCTWLRYFFFFFFTFTHPLTGGFQSFRPSWGTSPNVCAARSICLRAYTCSLENMQHHHQRILKATCSSVQVCRTVRSPRTRFYARRLSLIGTLRALFVFIPFLETLDSRISCAFTLD